APAFGDFEDPLLGRVRFASSVGRGRTRADDGCSTTILTSRDGDASAEAAHLVEAIAGIRDAHGDESIAILVRNRTHLAASIDELTARGIPWHGVDVHPLADRPVVSDLMTLLRALSSDDDRAAWLALLRAPLVGLTMRDLEAVAQAHRPASVARGVNAITGLS